MRAREVGTGSGRGVYLPCSPPVMLITLLCDSSLLNGKEQTALQCCFSTSRKCTFPCWWALTSHFWSYRYLYRWCPTPQAFISWVEKTLACVMLVCIKQKAPQPLSIMPLFVILWRLWTQLLLHIGKKSAGASKFWCMHSRVHKRHRITSTFPSWNTRRGVNWLNVSISALGVLRLPCVERNSILSKPLSTSLGR